MVSVKSEAAIVQTDAGQCQEFGQEEARHYKATIRPLCLKTVQDNKDTTCTVLHIFVSFLQHFDNFDKSHNFGLF